MALHYQRVPGEDGGVRDAPGEPPGTRLIDLLGGGLLPERVGLEVAQAACEILFIAEEDAKYHGDLDISDVYITGDGVVSLGGFDAGRARSRAPESSPRGATTDRYGLGMVLAALVYPRAEHLRDVPRNEAPRHDEAVRRWLAGADGGALPEGVDAVLRGQIEALLLFERFSRIEAVMVWRALRGAAESIPGVDLAAWALQAHRGSPQARRVLEADLELAPATAGDGPLAQPMKFSSTGQSTLFWQPGGQDDEATARPKRVTGEASIRLGLGELQALAREAAGGALPREPDPVAQRSYRPGADAAPVGGAGTWDWQPNSARPSGAAAASERAPAAAGPRAGAVQSAGGRAAGPRGGGADPWGADVAPSHPEGSGRGLDAGRGAARAAGGGREPADPRGRASASVGQAAWHDGAAGHPAAAGAAGWQEAPDAPAWPDPHAAAAPIAQPGAWAGSAAPVASARANRPTAPIRGPIERSPYDDSPPEGEPVDAGAIAPDPSPRTLLGMPMRVVLFLVICAMVFMLAMVVLLFVLWTQYVQGSDVFGLLGVAPGLGVV
jgi:hypothetical protein